MRARARVRFAKESPPGPVTIGAEVLESSGGDTIAEIRRVAEEHAPEGGYGETAYNGDDGTVCWVPADWTSFDEIDAAHDAFMEIDGVNGVVGDAEQALPDGAGWESVWPAPGSEEAYERVLALALRPLDVKFDGIVPSSAHYRPATVAGENCGTCEHFDGQHCTYFPGNPTVQADMVCDDWDARDDAGA